MTAPPCRRILLKLSGEALMGSGHESIDPAILERFASDVKDLAAAGVQLALVLGGGNIFRGAGLASKGLNRVTGDQMGMLATVMNALAMQDQLERLGVRTQVLSALRIDQVCEGYSRQRAVAALEQGQVVLFAAGTGNPLFTTDSAASLRAIEIGADLLIKATKVAGVYSADPVRDPDATFYPRISYDRALREGLQVMDTTAIVLCRDHGMPLRVMNINEPGALLRLLRGEDVGTLVASGE
ncbi:UMP kinase [uncultured Lamprocystis sp.]|jgi:uridylate kinase|uniref:UMP kinase n=2 Tax=uncultured Lamprocystis sp. TaxID=543132 RepID=UPI0025FDD259|nr:UMP kinase [uncultured Lamprocystis sp.]